MVVVLLCLCIVVWCYDVMFCVIVQLLCYSVNNCSLKRICLVCNPRWSWSWGSCWCVA